MFNFKTGVYSSVSSFCGAVEECRTEFPIDDEDEDIAVEEAAAAGVFVVAIAALCIVATALAARRQIIEDNIGLFFQILYTEGGVSTRRIDNFPGEWFSNSIRYFVFVDAVVLSSEIMIEFGKLLLAMRGCRGQPKIWGKYFVRLRSQY